ncbi:unnamed protein product, partial [Symbiodinium sp. KB8]
MTSGAQRQPARRLDGGQPTSGQIEGAPITFWDRIRMLSYHYTPVKQATTATHEWHTGHLPVTLLFFVGILAYAIFAFVQFSVRPTTESFFLAPAKGMTIPLQVSIWCSHAWACYDNATNTASGWRWDAATTVQSISGGVPGAACGQASLDATATTGRSRAALNSSAVDAFATTPAAERPAFAQGTLLGDATLCYSTDSADGILIRVPGFTTTSGVIYGDSAAPRLRVLIQGVPSATGAAATDGTLEDMTPMEVQLDIEPHQRKSVFIGSIVRQTQEESPFASLPFVDPVTDNKAGVAMDAPGVTSSTMQPYMADLFYEGKNDSPAAHLRIRMRQYVDVFR